MPRIPGPRSWVRPTPRCIKRLYGILILRRLCFLLSHSLSLSLSAANGNCRRVTVERAPNYFGLRRHHQYSAPNCDPLTDKVTTEKFPLGLSESSCFPLVKEGWGNDEQRTEEMSAEMRATRSGNGFLLRFCRRNCQKTRSLNLSCADFFTCSFTLFI